jgi:hypothetical protein
MCMKMAVFWYVAPCSLVDTDRCFRGAYCLHHQGDDRVNVVRLELNNETSIYLKFAQYSEHFHNLNLEITNTVVYSDCEQPRTMGSLSGRGTISIVLCADRTVLLYHEERGRYGLSTQFSSRRQDAGSWTLRKSDYKKRLRVKIFLEEMLTCNTTPPCKDRDKPRNTRWHAPVPVTSDEHAVFTNRMTPFHNDLRVNSNYLPAQVARHCSPSRHKETEQNLWVLY